MTGNLNVQWTLLDSAGKIKKSCNNTITLACSISNIAITPSSLYTLTIKGVGNGTDFTTGFSNYGSNGQYEVYVYAGVK
jgi:hypothetical protein